MDYIQTLRIFCTVCETGSFARTSVSMGVSTSVISRRIDVLEERFKVRLLQRNTRNFSLTEEGRILYDGSVRFLGNLDSLEQDVSTDAKSQTGMLRLVAHEASAHPLALLVSSFRERYPGITLDVTLSERPIDLVSEGLDVGILPPFMITSETVVTRAVARIPLKLVASPRYFNHRAVPTRPEDLRDHAFVAFASNKLKQDLTLISESESVSLSLQHEVASNSVAFILQMVLQGYGIGVVPASVASEHLRQGALEEILPGRFIVDHEAELKLAYSSRSHLPHKVRVFMDYAIDFYKARVEEEPFTRDIGAKISYARKKDNAEGCLGAVTSKTHRRVPVAGC